MVSRGLVSTSSQIGERHWTVVALLFALMLVGHDLVMTSPVAHAAPGSALSGHHQSSLHAVDTTSTSHMDQSVTVPHGASPCPVNRVAKSPSDSFVNVETEVDNPITAIDGLGQRLRNVALLEDSPPPLTAATRRALLQVFLM